MSAAEMTANGGKVSAGVAKLVDDAIGELHQAQKLVRELQEICNTTLKDQAAAHANRMWHKLESVDDRIHDALAKLGE